MNHHDKDKPNVAYTLVTDNKGAFGIKLDGELLIASNEDIEPRQYAVEVENFKVPELDTKKALQDELKSRTEGR